MNLRIVQQARVFETQLRANSPIELGRQHSKEKEPELFTELPGNNGARRIVIARENEADFSSSFVRLTPLGAGAVLVQNLSSRLVVPIAGLEPIPRGGSRTLPVPFTLNLPDREVWVGEKQTLDSRRIIFGFGSTMPEPLSRELPPVLGVELKGLMASLGYAVTSVQKAIGSRDFLQAGAEALVELANLHSGRVLLRKPERWNTEVTYFRVPALDLGADWEPSQTLLRELVEKNRPVWHCADEHTSNASEGDGIAESLGMVQNAIVAPLHDSAGQVIGALYGELPKGEMTAFQADSGLQDAIVELLVQMIAAGLSAGLARQDKEAEVARTRTLLGEFFPPALAKSLIKGDGLPQTTRSETVTILFCDVRNFSAITGMLGAVRTGEWIRDVLTKLSQCVLDEEGVLVDYVGDAIEAIWGAPEPQPDQTQRAVRAALAMLDALHDLNAKWEPTLGLEMGLGIGINRGEVLVGNIGSEQKYKYGALGDPVNISSRIQGVTKRLGCSLLVSESVVEQLPSDLFCHRRICEARLNNIVTPIDLYQVARHDLKTADFFRLSEEVLDLLEGKQFGEAIPRAGALLATHNKDGPLRLILKRALAASEGGGDSTFDPIWTPDGK